MTDTFDRRTDSARGATAWPADDAVASETRQPAARPARWRRSLLQWAATGATVLALGTGGSLLTGGAATFAQTGPGLPGAPFGQPPMPGAWLLGVMAEDATNGARVSRLMPGGAAERAGLQVGDIITAVDGAPVTSAQSLADRLSGKQPGATVSLSYTRNGAAATVTATLSAPTVGPGGPGGPGGVFGFVSFGGFGPVPGLDVLQNVPADQRFAHMLGSQSTVLDAAGNRVTYQTTPGKVMAVSATSLTIQANDPSRGAATYTITPDTKVAGRPVMITADSNMALRPVAFSADTKVAGGSVVVTAAPAGQLPTLPPAPPALGQTTGAVQVPPLTAGSITDFKAGDAVNVVVDAANPSVAKAVAGVPQFGTK